MDRFYLEFPDQVKPDEAGEEMRILREHGLKHEAAYLDRLKQTHKNVCEIASNKGDAQALTLEAMKSGADVIYQAALRSDGFAGFADFLTRAEGKSNLGDFHYLVSDTKLALKPKPYFIIQLCCYAEMLETIQGVTPSVLQIVLGNGDLRSFRTADYFYFYKSLKESFLKAQATFDPNKAPEVSALEKLGRWQSHAEQLMEECDHLSRVANIRATQIKKLKSAGINTLTELAQSQLSYIPDMQSDTLATLKQQARLQLESLGLPKPKYELIAQNPQNPRRGLTLLPPASANDVFFDMEGYPHVQGGLEYLFGATYIQDGEPEFRDWWAHNREEERQAFEEFVDWVHERWLNDKTMHIYHYNVYEVAALRKLMGRYGTREQEVDDLLRNEVFVDLYTVVRQGLRIGEPSYSIKNVEHLYREKRKGEVAKATDSIVFYERWLEKRDGDTWQTSKTLKDIRDYNQDDCDSTWQLARWLRDVQKSNGITWVPPEEKKAIDSEKVDRRNDAAQLAAMLLSDLPEPDEFSQDCELQELLAHLLEFHWREAKPVFWARYDRHAMTEQQLIDNIDCLGGLERTGTPPVQVKRSFAYEYSYDPVQDTKLATGDKCIYAHDLSSGTSIYSLDEEAGLASIKLGVKVLPPPQRLSLIPQDFVGAEKIAASIYRTVLHWHDEGELPQAIEDFLLRKRPRIVGKTAGKIIPDGVDLRQSAIDVVRNMDNTTLCIQGPPGGGKTTTAAAIIVELLKAGKKIGITSHSHQAICNLLLATAKKAKEAGLALNAAKLAGESDHELFNTGLVRHVKDAKAGFASGACIFDLVGGTAWAFSDEGATGTLDYLFVDEAGQVAVANIVGMAPSTTNIVLIGDQMQLSQPMKGAHPGESGKSALEYFLGEHQVIPEDLGIFLGLTYRLHPEICKFTSGAIYQDRLHSHPDAAARILTIPESGIKHISKTAGLLFVPVQHEGNTQGSDEEADMIAQLVEELLHCSVYNKEAKVNRPLKLDDILIVAPYNMQVRKIKSRLPNALVASVDKFQGREKPVVIVSMCASNATDSPRGLDFLFSKNRLNVAISRAETLAIVVANPALSNANCTSVEQMQLVNLFCRIVDQQNT
jgi:uncharacterized protein